MKDLDLLHFSLGVDVKYFERGIHLNQIKYVSKLLAKTEMTLARALSIHLAQKYGLDEAVGSLDAFLYKMITLYAKPKHGTSSRGKKRFSRCMDTLILIGEVVPPLGDKLQAITFT
uniref:Reverse transcriptase Ty1/copia-type domain-containing protein n=1 Tax=Solanum lycopersicum TaxID=4081 RepID=A0A3Q7I2T3_SOLLC